MGGYVYRWKPMETTVNQEKFSINDIGLILDCNFRKAKEIKLDILKELKENGIDYPCTRSSKIKREDLFNYIEKHYQNKLPTKSDIIIDNKYIKTKEEILKQVFVNFRDIKMLVNCPIAVAQEIYNNVKEIMESKNMEILLNHVLTKYVIKYLNDNDIVY